MNTSKTFVRDILIFGVMAVTIKIVGKAAGDTAAWMYSAALLLGYLISKPERMKTFTDFFNQTIGA